MEPTQPQPIASWSPDLDCWTRFDDETESLFSVPSVVFSETFPTSGMTVAGTAYELPTSEPRTDDSASSSLPTPRATRGGSNTETVRLLPTTTAGDAKSTRNSTATRHKTPPTGVHAGDTLTDIFCPPPAPPTPLSADPARPSRDAPARSCPRSAATARGAPPCPSCGRARSPS